jgi:uncharacterized membrane protein (UPF0127 family)
MKYNSMRRVRSRVAVGSMALALLISACASSNDVAETTPSEPTDTVSIGEVSTARVAPEVAEPVEVESEISDTDDGKDVVTRAAGVEGDGVLPQGFGSVTARVTSRDGEVCEVCLWLADDDVSRRRGLMDVTDLGDGVGMAFGWEQPRDGNFFMFQTPTPLSIAWFDAAGSHVGQADMEPCLLESSAQCERYTADSPYVLAVEMFSGQLDAIGIGPGSSVVLLDIPCVRSRIRGW